MVNKTTLPILFGLFILFQASDVCANDLSELSKLSDLTDIGIETSVSYVSAPDEPRLDSDEYNADLSKYDLGHDDVSVTADTELESKIQALKSELESEENESSEENAMIESEVALNEELDTVVREEPVLEEPINPVLNEYEAKIAEYKEKLSKLQHREKTNTGVYKDTIKALQNQVKDINQKAVTLSKTANEKILSSAQKVAKLEKELADLRKSQVGKEQVSKAAPSMAAVAADSNKGQAAQNTKKSLKGTEVEPAPKEKSIESKKPKKPKTPTIEANNYYYRSAIAHYNLGVFFMRDAEYEKAVREFNYSLEMDPTNSDAVFNLAVIYDIHLNETQKAIRNYRRYLQLSPASHDAKLVEGFLIKAEAKLWTGQQSSKRQLHKL